MVWFILFSVLGFLYIVTGLIRNIIIIYQFCNDINIKNNTKKRLDE